MNLKRNRSQILLSVLALLTVGSLVLALVASAILDALSTEGDATRNNQTEQDDAVESALRATVVADPESADAAAALASYLANTSRGPEAVGQYETAVALAPNDGSTRLAFARALAALGYPRDAELQFQAAIRLNDADPQAHYYLAELYHDWSPPRIVDAIREYQATVERGSGTFVAEQAAAALEKLLPASPAATPIE